MGAGQPVLDPGADAEHGRGFGVDAVGGAGCGSATVHRLRGWAHGIGEGLGYLSRPRGCDVGWRRRGTDHSLGGGGVRGHARAVTRNDAPQQASRPFDADRDGFVIGEAGAVLVLEELEHAKRRGASVYAEVAGYGVSSDAQHITEPDPTGENPARAMRMALQDAGVAPDEIDYINAHGTSTPLGDASETHVIKTALGTDLARRISISSTKGATGHCLGASGAVEAIFCALAIRTRSLPPTINQQQYDPDCDLDYIPNQPRQADVRVAVSNSFGFGGHNSTLVLRRFEE